MGEAEEPQNLCEAWEWTLEANSSMQRMEGGDEPAGKDALVLHVRGQRPGQACEPLWGIGRLPLGEAGLRSGLCCRMRPESSSQVPPCPTCSLRGGDEDGPLHGAFTLLRPLNPS